MARGCSARSGRTPPSIQAQQIYFWRERLFGSARFVRVSTVGDPTLVLQARVPDQVYRDDEVPALVPAVAHDWS